MNELAQVVHDLVTGKRETHLDNLSQTERTILEELKYVFRYSPEDMAGIMAADSSRWPPASIKTRAWTQS